jgi:hypothetical protein
MLYPRDAPCIDGRCPSLRTRSEKKNARRVAWVEHRSSTPCILLFVELEASLRVSQFQGMGIVPRPSMVSAAKNVSRLPWYIGQFFKCYPSKFHSSALLYWKRVPNGASSPHAFQAPLLQELAGVPRQDACGTMLLH